jgi:hypothetical protein
MSWHFLQEREEGFWADHNLDGAPDALLRLIPTQENVSCLDNETEYWSRSPSGTTSRPLAVISGEAPLTSSPEDFPAKTYPPLDGGGGFPVRKADYGSKWRELSVRYDLGSSLWKTHRCLWSEVLEPLSVTFPRWGMILGGVLWERITQELITSETGSGYWPTPTAHNAKEGNYPAERTRKTPTLASLVGGKLNPTWVEWLMGWPLGWTDLNPIKMEELLRWKIAFPTDQSVCEQSETDKSLPQ